MEVKRDIRQEKNELRQKSRQFRAGLTAERKRKKDVDIAARFLSLVQYRKADTVLTYVSTEIEVDTRCIISAALANGKRVAVPRCVPGTREMEFYYINGLDDLSPGAFGVLEPLPDSCEILTDFTQGICIVPGLCFDAMGFRLGYGKGYYDRFLSGFSGVTVGLCYVDCVKWRLPHGRFDRPVHLLLTENYLRRTAMDS